MQEYIARLDSRSDKNRWLVISELARLEMSDELMKEFGTYQALLRRITQDPLMSLHPEISVLKDWLALARRVEVVATPQAALVNVHDQQLAGAKKYGQYFLDDKIPKVDGVSPEDFYLVAEEIKLYMQGGATISADMVDVVSDYLNFLIKENNARNQHTQGCSIPGVKSIWQIWQLCKGEKPTLEHNIFFDPFYEAAIAYKGSEIKLWVNPSLDYSCHIGMEERLQLMAGKIAASLLAEDKLPYSALLSDYVAQHFSILSNSSDGTASMITINQETQGIIHEIALSIVLDTDFVTREADVLLGASEINKKYTQIDDRFTIKPEYKDERLPETIVTEGIKDGPAGLPRWLVSNKIKAPKKKQRYIEFIEGKLDLIAESIITDLYIRWGMADSWLFDLVFIDEVHKTGQEGLHEKVIEYLENNCEDLSNKQKLETGDDYVAANIERTVASLDRCFTYMVQQIIEGYR
jgi:hypothetical protein